MTDDALSLEEAYEAAGFNVIKTGAGVDLPTSTPVALEFDDVLDVTAEDIRDRIEEGRYACIAPYCQNRENGTFTLSAKVYDAEANEFFNVKVYPASMRVFPRENFTLAMLERFVDHFEGALGVDTTPRVIDDG